MPPLTLLELEPANSLAFSLTPGGSSYAKLRLTNTSGTLVAYKVKSTAPKNYAIRPSGGSIRRGESAEVQIARKAAANEEEEGAAAAGGEATQTQTQKQRKDRFLVQAAVVDSDEKKLLLHAAQRGKTAGAAKFWEGVPKDALEEQQLVVSWLPGPGPQGPGQAQGQGPSGAGAEARPGGQGQGGPGAAGPAPGLGRHAAAPSGPGAGFGRDGQGMPSQQTVDAILGKLSLPGRSPPAAPEASRGPPGLAAVGSAEGPPGLVPSLSDGPGFSGSGSGAGGGVAAPGPPPAARGATGAATGAALAPGPGPGPGREQVATKRRDDVVLQKHSRPVTFVTLEPGGRVLYSCSKDKVVLAWGLPSGELLRRYEGHRGAVWACSVSPEGALLLTCGADSAVLLWDAASAQQLAEVQMPGVVRWVEWAPPSHLGLRRFAACSNSFKSKPASLAVMDFTEEGSSEEGTMIESHQLVLIEEPALPSGASQVVWAGPQGSHLCSVHGSGELLFWRATDGLLQSRVAAHEGPVSQVAFPQDRCLMASCGRTDMQVKLWSLASFGLLTAETIPTLLCSFLSDRPLNAVSLRPHLSLEEVLSASSAGDKSCTCDCLAGGGQDARDVALVGAGTDDQFDPVPLRLAEHSGTLEPLLPPGADDRHKGSGHFGPIHTLAFSLDGAICVSGSEDGNVRLRDLSVDPILAASVLSAPPQMQQPQRPPQVQQQQQQQHQQQQQQRRQQPKPVPTGRGASATMLPAAAIATEQSNRWQPRGSGAPPVAGLRAVAIADFDPSTIGWPPSAPQRPLPLRRGQEIEITQDAGGGWSWGRAVCKPGVGGLLPSNYILPLSTYEEMLQKTFEQQKKDQVLAGSVLKDAAAGLPCRQTAVSGADQEGADPAEEDGDCSQS